MQGYTKIPMATCRGVEIIVCAFPSIGVDHFFWCAVLLNSAGPLQWHQLWHYYFVCSTAAELRPNGATVDLGKIDRKCIKYHNKINTTKSNFLYEFTRGGGRDFMDRCWYKWKWLYRFFTYHLTTLSGEPIHSFISLGWSEEAEGFETWVQESIEGQDTGLWGAAKGFH